MGFKNDLCRHDACDVQAQSDRDVQDSCARDGQLDKKSPLMLACGAVFGVSLEKMSKNSEYSFEKVYLYSETRRWSISLLNENPRKQVAFGGKNADTVVLDNMPYSIMQNYVK